MKIAFHGGKCCGIKTIHSLDDRPSEYCRPLRKKIRTYAMANADQHNADVSSQTNFYPNAAPVETYLERLDRYIKYLDAVRPNGIIEIVLNEDYDHQKDKWEPVLFERDFVLVTHCMNSNSGNRIYVYHRKIDEIDEGEE